MESVTASSGHVQLTVKNSSITAQKVGAIDARDQRGISSQGGAAVVSFGDNVLVGNVSKGSFMRSGTKR